MTEPTTYEKGLALELKLAELFKAKGYEAVHNVKKVGRSGAEHQIDVLASYRNPLHTSTLVIEAKSYDAPIDKERIMKLIQIVDDVGADRGVIITTSYFTPDAIKTAEGHNIDLWNREHLTRIIGEMEVTAVQKGISEKVAAPESFIQPRLNYDQAKGLIDELLQKRRKGGFLGAGRIVEHLEGVSLLYYPYYEAEIQLAVSEEQKTGLMSKRIVEKIVSAKVPVDALLGDVVRPEGTLITYPYSHLSSLEEDEIGIMRTVGLDWFDISRVIGLGYSEGKAGKLLKGLVGKGVVERRATRPIAYKVRVQFPDKPHTLFPISEMGSTQATGEGVILSPLLEPSSVIRALESYWAKVNVKGITSLHYPYYVYVLRSEDGSRRVEVIDGISGSLNEVLGTRVKWDTEKTLNFRKPFDSHS
ncbi:MAG: restriction endonuclease [Thaumarchaeota archaeon]|nr:restriction endonuclease [Nitrososphaerota archaeon]